LTYDYEALDPEKFQEFAQALILREDPSVQVFPIGQADGGRDDLRRAKSSTEP